MTSPPGGGIVARPNRASSGPASRKEARIRSPSSRSTLVWLTSTALIWTLPAAVQVTVAPSEASSASIASTSLIRGTLRSVTSSSVSRQAARIGSAPFLFPAGTTVP